MKTHTRTDTHNRAITSPRSMALIVRSPEHKYTHGLRSAALTQNSEQFAGICTATGTFKLATHRSTGPSGRAPP